MPMDKEVLLSYRRVEMFTSTTVKNYVSMNKERQLLNDC